MIISLVAWLTVIAVAATAVHAVRHGIRYRDYRGWAVGALFACAVVILLAVLGVLRPLPAGFLAAMTAGTTAAISVKVSGRKGPATFAGFAASALGFLGADAVTLWRRLTGFTGEEGGTDTPGPAAEAVKAAVATRAIPSLREDPHLGAPPEPAEIAASSPVPPPYAALARYIAQCEPEDDIELRMFMEGDAAGQVAISEARQAFADHCLNGAGLAPAYVAGILEVGDAEADLAAVKVQAHRRFGVIYGAVKEWVAAHGPLPHRARQFLSGEDAA